MNWIRSNKYPNHNQVREHRSLGPAGLIWDLQGPRLAVQVGVERVSSLRGIGMQRMDRLALRPVPSPWYLFAIAKVGAPARSCEN